MFIYCMFFQPTLLPAWSAARFPRKSPQTRVDSPAKVAAAPSASFSAPQERETATKTEAGVTGPEEEEGEGLRRPLEAGAECLPEGVPRGGGTTIGVHFPQRCVRVEEAGWGAEFSVLAFRREGLLVMLFFVLVETIRHSFRLHRFWNSWTVSS